MKLSRLSLSFILTNCQTLQKGNLFFAPVSCGVTIGLYTVEMTGTSIYFHPDWCGRVRPRPACHTPHPPTRPHRERNRALQLSSTKGHGCELNNSFLCGQFKWKKGWEGGMCACAVVIWSISWLAFFISKPKYSNTRTVRGNK